jgi:hypothetical protein
MRCSDSVDVHAPPSSSVGLAANLAAIRCRLAYPAQNYGHGFLRSTIGNSGKAPIYDRTVGLIA